MRPAVLCSNLCPCCFNVPNEEGSGGCITWFWSEHGGHDDGGPCPSGHLLVGRVRRVEAPAGWRQGRWLHWDTGLPQKLGAAVGAGQGRRGHATLPLEQFHGH